MAATKDGRKYNDIPPYTYKRADGTKVQVPAHRRSNPSTSTGKAKK